MPGILGYRVSLFRVTIMTTSVTPKKEWTRRRTIGARKEWQERLDRRMTAHLDEHERRRRTEGIDTRELKQKPPGRFRLQNPNRSTSSTFEYSQRCENLGIVIHSSDLPKQETRRKPYQEPTAVQLSPEEAKRKLIDHAARGDDGAKEPLAIMFAEEAKTATALLERNCQISPKV